jgi:hypothetical protein
VGAGLLGTCLPADPAALAAAFQHLLGQLQGLKADLAQWLSWLHGTPAFLSVALVVVAVEWYRRRLQQTRQQLLLAGGTSRSWRWFPGVAGPGSSREDRPTI